MKVKDKGASGADDESTESTDVTDETDETQTDDDASGDDDEAGKKSVSHSTYKKTLAEAKRAKEQRRKMSEENDALKAKLLEAEGNKDEKIKSLAQQLTESRKREKQLLGSTIKKALNGQVKAEAAKAGCIDSDAVMKLLDLSDVEVDPDTLEADDGLLSEKISELKKAKPYLFSKAGPKINGKMPNGKAAEGEKEDLMKLSASELKLRLRALDKK